MRISPAPATGSGGVDSAVVLCRTLAALGVKHVAVSPGSRSAPLVYALTDPALVAGSPTPLRAHVRIDERAAAFTALGISRATPQHPAAIVTTSGTATAHLLAAVMEAHHSHVPLIVITADRPAELRGTGANQTTRQENLFSDFVRYRVDVPAPTAQQATPAELRTIANLASRAFAAATGEDAGPVHLNLALRDPLVPTGGVIPDGQAEDELALWITERERTAESAPVEVVVDARTVVVAGDGAGAAAREFAEAQSLPLLAEPSSGARAGECLVRGYPALLREVMAAASDDLRPHRAIVCGHPTLSRPVIGGLLGAADVEVIVVDRTLAWNDPTRNAHRVVPAIAAAQPDREERARREAVVSQWRRRGDALAGDRKSVV